MESLQNVTDLAVRSLVYRVETKTGPAVPLILREEPAIQKQRTTVSPPPHNNTHRKCHQQVISPLTTRTPLAISLLANKTNFAHAAAQAVAAHPGGTYNPLFIYGGVGLGKTHLLHAIANEIRNRNSGARILYVTCEHFTNDFIHSIRSGKGKDFKDRYRNIDLLPH